MGLIRDLFISSLYWVIVYNAILAILSLFSSMILGMDPISSSMQLISRFIYPYMLLNIIILLGTADAYISGGIIIRARSEYAALKGTRIHRFMRAIEYVSVILFIILDVLNAFSG